MSTQVETRLIPPRLAAPETTLPAVRGWRLARRVAHGPTCDVFQAQAESGSGPACYALKLLRPEWSEHPRAVDLLQREAVVGRTVSHRHLVAVLAAQVETVPRYCVFPWLDGVTLDRLLDARQRLPLSIALWIARQTAEAIAALHDAGWVHGDVKPANILVASGWHATLLDLGFARQIGEVVSVDDRFGIGSAAYLAPEVLNVRGSVDSRSDIYSLGTTLFHLLSGRPPYYCESFEAMVEAQRREAPPRLQSLAPTLPIEVAELVHSMLARDPLRRPQSADDVVARLVRLEIDALAERF